jgi:hypothetical protein
VGKNAKNIIWLNVFCLADRNVVVYYELTHLIMFETNNEANWDL